MKQTSIDEAIAKLTDKGVKLPCPRCGKTRFSVIGESIIHIQYNEPLSIASIPSSIPTIIVACDNCGYVAQHAKGPLGLKASRTAGLLRGIGEYE